MDTVKALKWILNTSLTLICVLATMPAAAGTSQGAIAGSSSLNNYNNQINAGAGYYDTHNGLMNEDGRLAVEAIGVDYASWQQITDSVSYSIDPATLGLTVNYTYTFTLRPSLRSAQSETPLKPGKYHLRIAVVLANSATEEYSAFAGLGRNPRMVERVVATKQMVVTVRANGLISEVITLPFQSVSSTVVANDIMFEVTELENDGESFKKSNLVQLGQKRSMILTGKFIPFLDGRIESDGHYSRIQRVPKKLHSLRTFIVDAEKARAAYQQRVPVYRTTADAAQAYAREGRLKFLNLNSSEILSVMNLPWAKRANVEQKVRDFFSSPNTDFVYLHDSPAAIATFCQLLANRAGDDLPPMTYLDCQQNPEKYMRIGKNIHVGAIDTNRVKDIRSRVAMKGYDVTGVFSINRSRSEDQFYSWHMNPFGIIFKAIETLGIPSPVTFDYTINQGNSRGTAQSMMVRENSRLDVNTAPIPIPLKRYLTCINVQPTENSPFNKGSANQFGYYICNTREEQNMIAVEEYVHMFQPWQPTSLASYQSPSSQGVNIMMRGNRDVVSFLYQIRGSLTTDQTVREDSRGVVNSVVEYIQANRSAIPNIISVPVEVKKGSFSQTNKPTLWERILGQYEEKFQLAAE